MAVLVALLDILILFVNVVVFAVVALVPLVNRYFFQLSCFILEVVLQHDLPDPTGISSSIARQV